jgi:hypothetical protein
MGRGKRVQRRAVSRSLAPVRAESPARRLVVVPDVHGHPELLREALLAAGAIDASGTRLPEVRVVGLGDLVHGTAASEEGDAQVLDYAERWLDQSLIGNHEAALIGLTSFEGVWRQSPISSRIRSLCFQGFYVPALLEGETLLTHAGVGPSLAGADAKETYARILTAWDDDPAGDFFQAVSSPLRGGKAEAGGIMWLHWGEPRAEHVSQIVGHSPQDEAALVDYGQAFHLNLDASTRDGRRLVAAVLEDGEPVELVTVEDTPDAE